MDISSNRRHIALWFGLIHSIRRVADRGSLIKYFMLFEQLYLLNLWFGLIQIINCLIIIISLLHLFYSGFNSFLILQRLLLQCDRILNSDLLLQEILFFSSCLRPLVAIHGWCHFNHVYPLPTRSRRAAAIRMVGSDPLDLRRLTPQRVVEAMMVHLFDRRLLLAVSEILGSVQVIPEGVLAGSGDCHGDFVEFCGVGVVCRGMMCPSFVSICLLWAIVVSQFISVWYLAIGWICEASFKCWLELATAGVFYAL